MPRVHDLLREKAAEGLLEVVVTRPLEKVVEAARAMNERRIGALPVVDDAGRLVGMFTERDVLTRIVAAGRDPETTRVGDVMTSPVLACEPTTPLDDLRGVMRERRVRHIPVVDDGAVVGMVSIGDLNTIDARVMTETINYLERYMYNA